MSLPAKISLPFYFDEISDPGSRAFRLSTNDIMLEGFVVRKGRYTYAYRNSCPHTGVSLNWSEDVFLNSDEEFIQCAMHGALFTIDAGYCIWGPCRGESLVKIEMEIDNKGQIVIEI